MIYPMLSLLLFGAGDLEILATGKDRVELAAAAIRVASAGDGGALESLSSHLGTRAFLERLDESANPQLAQYHLQRVFEALAAHPSPAVERLCLRLADAREFSARGSRMVLLLRALAAVKPMSEAGARLFVRTNANGHYSSNGPLLASNGSPRAMGVLEAMFRRRTGRSMSGWVWRIVRWSRFAPRWRWHAWWTGWLPPIFLEGCGRHCWNRCSTTGPRSGLEKRGNRRWRHPGARRPAVPGHWRDPWRQGWRCATI